MIRLMMIVGILVIYPLIATAQGFSDDFESGLTQWVGKSGGAHNGVTVTDPLDANNNVLSFSATNNTGDVFGLEFMVSMGFIYELSFDYLGLPTSGTPSDDTGGTIGISNGLPGTGLRWLAGTINDNDIVLELIDDGQWHSYSIPFDPWSELDIPSGVVRVTIEDWDGAACQNCTPGVAGDAFFDNVQLQVAGTIAVEGATWGKIKALFER